MADNPSPQDKSWRILSSQLVADSSPFVRVYDESFQIPGGKILHHFLRVEVAPFAIVFALLEDGRVPMVQQYRVSIGREVLELPAGMIDPGESPLSTMQRELLEEAGVEASEWFSLGSFVPDANRGCGLAHCFAARGGRLVAPPDPRDLGMMSLHLLTVEEVKQRWTAGEFVLAPTTLTIGLALQKLGL